MAKKIEKLTPEQEVELPLFRQRYLDIACGGGRIDRPALEAALADAYSIIGRPAPKLFIFDSPTETMMAIKIFEIDGKKSANLRENLGDNLGDNLRVNLGDNLRVNLWENLRVNLRENLWENLGDNLWENLWENLGDNLRVNLRDNLWDNLRVNLWVNLRENLWENLGDNLWENLWENLWDNLRVNLRENLWDNLRVNLGDNLRVNLRDNLRVNLRENLWENLGDNLRVNLREKKIWDPNFLWGSQDLYWIAYYRFAQKIGVPFAESDSKKLDVMERISMQCEWWWPYENIVFTSQRPSLVKRDEEGRLHCEAGMAVEYSNGDGISVWHGQNIPDEWVSGSPPSPPEALHWPNMDQRTVACDIVGWHNILDQLNAVTIDRDEDPMIGALVEVDLPDSGKERFLDVMCGTGRRFALPVPPHSKTALQAQAELHGLPEDIIRSIKVRT